MSQVDIETKGSQTTCRRDDSTWGLKSRIAKERHKAMKEAVTKRKRSESESSNSQGTAKRQETKEQVDIEKKSLQTTEGTTMRKTSWTGRVSMQKESTARRHNTHSFRRRRVAPTWPTCDGLFREVWATSLRQQAQSGHETTSTWFF